MRPVLSLSLLMAAAAAASSADAAVTLIANGQLTGSSAGSYADLSGLTNTLENGVPDNLLGGLGSAIAYAGGNRFLALPDRGPNAVPFNSNIDDTVSYENRYQTVSMKLAKSAPGSSLPLTLTTTLDKTTLLYSSSPLIYGTGAGEGNDIDGVTPVGSGAPSINTKDKFYFTGRSDNFGTGSSGNPLDARFDTEGMRLSNDGKDVFISDEYGPYVREFTRSGKLVKTFTLPGNLDVAHLSAQGANEMAPFNTSGRVANKGMEGLAITPDGKTLVGIIQAPLIQDAANSATKKMLRIVTIDIATGTTHEYGYKLTTGSGVSEILAVNDHQFLVDERDGTGLGDAPGEAAVSKQLFEIDLSGATDITNLSGTAAAAAEVTKTSFLDVVAGLGAAGIPATAVPAKIEGIAFGQDVNVGGQDLHTLWVSNDNDFLQNSSGPNQFYVFGFTDRDLPGYVPQGLAAIPETSTWSMLILGLGALGAAARTRRKAVAIA